MPANEKLENRGTATFCPVRWGFDSTDSFWIGVYRVGLSVTAVSGGDVQRPLLPRRYLNVDRRGGRHGLYGAGAEPPDVPPVRRCDEKSQPGELEPCRSGEIGIRSF